MRFHPISPKPLLLIALASSPALGIGVTQTITPINQGNAIQISFTVTNDTNQIIKDFHLRSSKKLKGTPLSSDNGTPGDTRDDWSASKANGEAHWVAPNGGIDPGRSATFVLQVDGMTAAQFENANAHGQWFATSDGERRLTERSQVIQQGGLTSAGTALRLPMAAVGMSVQPMDFAQRGMATPISIHAPDGADLPYALLAAFGDGPGIPLGPNLLLPLSYDPLLELSLLNVFLQPHPVFQGWSGTTGPLGSTGAALVIPPEPLLGGLELHVAGIVLDPLAPSGVRSISDAAPLRIR